MFWPQVLHASRIWAFVKAKQNKQNIYMAFFGVTAVTFKF